jgi:hypothetical protein
MNIKSVFNYFNDTYQRSVYKSAQKSFIISVWFFEILCVGKWIINFFGKNNRTLTLHHVYFKTQKKKINNFSSGGMQIIIIG